MPSNVRAKNIADHVNQFNFEKRYISNLEQFFEASSNVLTEKPKNNIFSERNLINRIFN